MSVPFWKKVLLPALLALSFVMGAADAAGEPWQTGSPAFTVEGVPREPTPVLLYFTAPWCGFCQQMQRTTLAEPGVVARLRRLRAYKLDFDTESGLARRFGVSGIPAFVLTNDRGEAIARLTGARATADFLAWLTQAEAEFGVQVKTAAVVAEALRTLPAEARAVDASTRTRALETLWTLAGRAGDFERAAALKTLATLVSGSESAAIWRTGLGHADLAVRVAAANLLQQVSNGKRSFDPWADEKGRMQSLAEIGF